MEVLILGGQSKAFLGGLIYPTQQSFMFRMFEMITLLHRDINNTMI